MNRNLLHTPEGVRDIYGMEYARKLAVEENIRKKLFSFGYEDIQTPTFEYFDVFSREVGTTPSRDLYKFFDKEGETLVLRPDFTPSIARCAAKYFCEENIPLRFCYLGNTYTNTSNLQGKLKEVTQIGAELIGEPFVEADAEMINLVIETLLNTGLENFQVSIGEVEYFKGLCEEAGLNEETEMQLRECISAKNYYAAEDILMIAGVAEEQRKLLLTTTDVFGSIDALRESKKAVKNARSLKAIERLEQIYEVLSVYGTESYVSFDLGMLSKYKYYTGIIFKAYTYGIGDAIVKGGRYDALLEHFGKDAPAIGFVAVVDDILEALSRQKVEIPVTPRKTVLTYTREDYANVLKQAQDMRKAGIAVEMVRKEAQTNE